MIAFFLAPVYLLINLYVLRWLLRYLDEWFVYSQRTVCRRILKIFLSAIYILLCTSMLTAFLLPHSSLQKMAARIGNYWLGTFLYIVLVIVAADLLRLLLRRNSFFQRRVSAPRKMFLISGGFCCLLVIGVSLYGGWNARHIRTTRYDVAVRSEDMAGSSLKIVLVADLHMGYSIGYRQVEKMADRINQEDPDLVCIAGDIFDNSYDSLDNPDKIREALSSIRSRYGVYACYGNHDYEEDIFVGFTFPSEEKTDIGNKMRRLLEESGIQTLEDEVELIDGRFYLAGRKDASIHAKSGEERKPAGELLSDLDPAKPVIVMDHQPKELTELAYAGADLDLCGHTHDGQLFPGNILTGLMWKNPWGYLQVGEMHNIVTSGVGVYGPYMRVGTIAEIAAIRVEFYK